MTFGALGLWFAPKFLADDNPSSQNNFLHNLCLLFVRLTYDQHSIWKPDLLNWFFQNMCSQIRWYRYSVMCSWSLGYQVHQWEMTGLTATSQLKDTKSHGVKLQHPIIYGNGLHVIWWFIYRIICWWAMVRTLQPGELLWAYQFLCCNFE